MNALFRYLGTVAAVLITVNVVPGVVITGGPPGGWGFATPLLVALVWSVITLVIRPVLSILTLPVTIVTFGLFSFVLNAALFYAMQFLVPAFTADGFLAALLGSVALSLLNWFIGKLIP